jgi:hypothetical protein
MAINREPVVVTSLDVVMGNVLTSAIVFKIREPVVVTSLDVVMEMSFHRLLFSKFVNPWWSR